MRIIADIHVHSPYARATSARCTVPGLAHGAKIKGLNVLATGDFTHPQWFHELRTHLSQEEQGLFPYQDVRFILSVEVSCIFELNKATKKMHHVLLAPYFDIAAQINDRLKKYGNLAADGRPTLSISSAGLVEELMQISKEIVIVPSHCLLPGTTIQCNPKIKPIEEIKQGNFVYTHKGRARKVTKLFKRPYTGDVHKIIPWYFSLGVTATSEHPIYAIKTVKNCSWTKGLVCKPTVAHLRYCYHHFYEQYQPQWVLARDIEKGDVLLYPRLNKIKNCTSIPIKYRFRDRVIKRTIKVDKAFCRLIGYYLAEGYSNQRDAIAFTFSPSEAVYLDDVKKLMKLLFGLKCKQGKTRGDLIFYSRWLRKFFENLLYGSNKQKRAFTKALPKWMLFLPLDRQVEIFKGWWRGDKGSTSSRILANQMKTICLRLGIMPGIRVDSRSAHRLRGKHKIGNRMISAAYDNFIFNSLTFFEDKFNLLYEDEFKEFNYKLDRRHGWIDEKYVYLPVRKIEKSHYDGYVYNLEVEDDNSYLTEFAAVHNCWTPWFAIFGSRSGVDSVEEAFEDQARHIFALETGLSSDPEMNWMISKLDKYTLVSNSDAHSLRNLGREANVFDLEEISYNSIIQAIKTRKGFVKTYEFYPEEGKYHYDGHRNCKVILNPTESKKYGNICPTCKRKLTLGVLHRVADLADRKYGFKPDNAVPFQHIVPLPTVISKALGKGLGTQAVDEEYDRLIRYFGNEFAVFEAKEEQINMAASPVVANALLKVQSGNIKWIPGYDGVFGQLILNEKMHSKTARDKKQKTLEEF